jgi:hypothetical protein
MGRREIAGSGVRVAFGIAALTALVALLQIVSCNRADSAGEGSWIMPCWVYEEEKYISGTFPVRVGNAVIQVPDTHVRHHWHPLAVVGWILPPAIALIGLAVAIRQRNRRPLKLAAFTALGVLVAAYFIAPLVAWHIGPEPGAPGPARGGETLGSKAHATPDTPEIPRLALPDQLTATSTARPPDFAAQHAPSSRQAILLVWN